MSLAPFVATLGRGPGRSRSLTRDEARQAMEIMLTGKGAPEAVGALLMLLRMKGETSEEIAGFAEAAQASVTSLPQADVDWPSYAAGRSRGLPWFLLSARLVAQAGHKVLLHGQNGSDAAVRDELGHAGITRATTKAQAAAELSKTNITYIALEDLSTPISDLLALRPIFGLRSCVNTMCRMLNPARAKVSVQGVFHPPYRLLQADAAHLLGWPALTVIKGGGGEFERHPGKHSQVFGIRKGERFDTLHAPLTLTKGRLADGPDPATTLNGLWSGHQQDDFAEALVIGTAALVFDALGHEEPDAFARAQWATRSMESVA